MTIDAEPHQTLPPYGCFEPLQLDAPEAAGLQHQHRRTIGVPKDRCWYSIAGKVGDKKNNTAQCRENWQGFYRKIINTTKTLAEQKMVENK